MPSIGALPSASILTLSTLSDWCTFERLAEHPYTSDALDEFERAIVQE